VLALTTAKLKRPRVKIDITPTSVVDRPPSSDIEKTIEADAASSEVDSYLAGITAKTADGVTDDIEDLM
jgi:hypothetical protein